MVPVTYTPQQQIKNALSCIADVAQLRLQYGGWPVAHNHMDSAVARIRQSGRGERMKAPRRTPRTKGTIRGLR